MDAEMQKDHEVVEQPQPENTVCLIHVKPVAGGYIVEAQPGGKNAIPGSQAIVAGEHGSANVAKGVGRTVRAMTKAWLEGFFEE